MGLEFVFSFLDDDGVFSKSKEEHWTHLRTLFAILAANGLALNLEKCVWIPIYNYLYQKFIYVSILNSRR
jgi:hypothetical protein